MKDSETKSQKSVGEKLEAPIQLTPDQLEKAAGGRAAQVDSKIKTSTTGQNPPNPIGIGKLT